MNLKDVLQGIEYASADKIDNLEIQGLSCDSKNIRPDFLFIAVKGHKLNGHQFIVEAVSRGAKAVISKPMDRLKFLLLSGLLMTDDEHRVMKDKHMA